MNATTLRTGTRPTTAPWLLVAIGAPDERERPLDRRRLVITVIAAVLVVALVVIAGGAWSPAAWPKPRRYGMRLRGVGSSRSTSPSPPCRTGWSATTPPRSPGSTPGCASTCGPPTWPGSSCGDATGRIVYSDEPRLIGHTYGLASDEREALEHGGTKAEVSDLAAPDNRYERGGGPLLEVYRGVHTPDGTPLLFEVYFRYDDVVKRSEGIALGFAAVTA